MYLKLISIVMLIALTSASAFSQKVRRADTTFQNKKNSVKAAADKVEGSLYLEKSDAELAVYYEELALELLNNGDTVKAEEYYDKALLYYHKTQNNVKEAELQRKLAMIQEDQKRYFDAVSNYSAASSNSVNKKMKVANSNDAQRLMNNNNPQKQLDFSKQNALIFRSEKVSDPGEISRAYMQMAGANNQLADTVQAIENLNIALSASQDIPIENKAQIVNSLSDIYVSQNMYDKAIDLQKNIIVESEKVNNDAAKAKQMQQLADIYFIKGNKQEGYEILLEAYYSAVKNGNLSIAKTCLSNLTEKYKQQHDNEQALKLYSDFIQNLDSIISRDSTIVNIKLFQLSESKIAKLEKEKQLREELISKKNRYNIMLSVFVILLIIMLLLIFFAWKSIKKQNKRIALQSMRREMNPHFIFNSLNSVNQFIANKNELQANKYLTSYSTLMREFMENSNNDFISLGAELQQIRKYLELEKLRFGEKFDYQIIIDENLDVDAEKVPNMIIQPNLENAIWHGLRYRDLKGSLVLKIEKNKERLQIIVEDDGIGLTKSKEIKTPNQLLNKSRGLNNILERIELLNDIYKSNIQFSIQEKTNGENGVIVKILI